jgi:hypothetical protein
MSIFDMSELINFLGNVAGLFGLIGMCAMPFSWFTIGPHYDKILKNVYNPMNAAFNFPKLGRATQYSLLVILGKGMNKSIDRLIFKDYDFRQDARLIDKMVAYAIWIPFFIAFIASSLLIICWLVMKASALV